jgi:hypothetical protein
VHSPSWESNSFLASQEMPRILWTLAVQSRIYNSPSLIAILRQVNPAHASFLFLEDSFHYCPLIFIGLSSGLFPSGLSNKILYAATLYFLQATCPAHLNLLDFITRIIFCEEYELWSFSLCSLLHPPDKPKYISPHPILIPLSWFHEP